MRAMLGVCLMICATSGIAVECGPTTTVKSLQAQLARIDRLRDNIDVHIEALLKEEDASSLSAQTEADNLRVRRLGQQTRYILSADQAGERLTSVVSRSLVIAQIRDAMLDKGDTERANTFLSNSLVGVHKFAVNLHRGINRTFAQITSPAAIHDVSMLRDVISEIAATYEKCSLPNQG